MPFQFSLILKGIIRSFELQQFYEIHDNLSRTPLTWLISDKNSKII